MVVSPDPDDRGILVADDDELLSEVVAMTLELHGYRVLRAPHGTISSSDALDAQLVILDAHVPGNDFAQTLRLLEEREIPVLVVSGESRVPDGVSPENYLAKPVDLDELLAAVRRLMPLGAGG
jgi:DNA-binding response OmpR family regulator